MFRAIPCSSSGGLIVLLQHLASSLSISSYSVHRLRADYVSSNTMLIFRRSNCIVTASGIVTLRKQLFSAPVDSGLQSAVNRCTEYYYRINKLCIKLVIETSL